MAGDIELDRYAGVIHELAKRIEALIPAHPEIMAMESAFELFKIKGFKSDDLQPSLGQASGALYVAQQNHLKK